MTTISVWLLLSIGSLNKQTLVIERFATESECNRIIMLIDKHTITSAHRYVCTQATIIKQ